VPIPAAVNPVDSNLRCPSCSGPLRPALLACDHCGITVEGPFRLNEFATMEPDDLHFLRIFIRCEGRVRDMESALGLSYPTIRGRIADLKRRLHGDEADGQPRPSKLASEPPPPEPAPPPDPPPLKATKKAAQPGRPVQPRMPTGEVLDLLHAGRISFDEAMARLKSSSPPDRSPP